MVNGEVHSYHVDLTKKSDVYRVADRVKKEVGKVRKIYQGNFTQKQL